MQQPQEIEPEPVTVPLPSHPRIAHEVADRQTVRGILRELGGLSVDVGLLSDHTDLFSVGFEPRARVEVMVALEERFGVHFPDRMLGPARFRSVAAIAEGVEELLARLP